MEQSQLPLHLQEEASSYGIAAPCLPPRCGGGEVPSGIHHPPTVPCGGSKFGIAWCSAVVHRSFKNVYALQESI